MPGDKTGRWSRKTIAMLFLVLLPLSWSPGARSATASYFEQATLDWGGEVLIEVSFKSDCVPEMSFSEPVARITVRNTWEDDALLLDVVCDGGHDCLLDLTPHGSTDDDVGPDAGEPQELGDYVVTTTAGYTGTVGLHEYDSNGYQCHGQIIIEVETVGGESGWLLYGSEYNPGRSFGCGG